MAVAKVNGIAIVPWACTELACCDVSAASVSKGARSKMTLSNSNFRALPPPTLAALYPPIRGYRYFDAPAGWAFQPSAGLADLQAHWWLAEHALLAYERAGKLSDVLGASGYRVAIARDVASSSFAYAAIAADHGILAFRGTEALKPGDSWRKLAAVARDWWIDARVARIAADHGQVHAGFMHALDAIWPQLRTHLHKAPIWWCTGHSLGGALAVLAAARLADEHAHLRGVLSFGQPRVGDIDNAARLQQLPLLRVVNACDLVPDLPPEALGYQHAGALRHLDAHDREHYGRRVRAYWSRLPKNLQHGIGALTPIELIDHAPLHYVVKCFNTALQLTRR